MRKLYRLTILSLGISLMCTMNVHAFNPFALFSLEELLVEDKVEVIDPYKGIPYVEGETSVGLQVIDSFPADTLQFEVPLYVTMAVVDEKKDVIVPGDYGIRNLSIGSDGEGVDLAVIWMETTARSTNNYWNFVQTLNGDVDEMILTLGGVPIVVKSGLSTKLDLSDSVFYNNATEKFIPIPYEELRNVELIGEVIPTNRTILGNASAVAQFSVRYTVSQLDLSGDPVGVYYEGPTIE